MCPKLQRESNWVSLVQFKLFTNVRWKYSCCLVFLFQNRPNELSIPGNGISSPHRFYVTQVQIFILKLFWRVKVNGSFIWHRFSHPVRFVLAHRKMTFMFTTHAHRFLCFFKKLAIRGLFSVYFRLFKLNIKILKINIWEKMLWASNIKVPGF